MQINRKPQRQEIQTKPKMRINSYDRVRRKRIFRLANSNKDIFNSIPTSNVVKNTTSAPIVANYTDNKNTAIKWYKVKNTFERKLKKRDEPLQNRKGFSNYYAKNSFAKRRKQEKNKTNKAIKTFSALNRTIIQSAINQKASQDKTASEVMRQTHEEMAREVKNKIKQKAVAKAKNMAYEGTKRTAVATAQATYKSAKFVAKKIATAMVKLAQITIASIGGGSFLVSFIAIFAIVACVVASPFGIFFSGEDKSNPDVIPLSVVVGNLNSAFSLKLEQIQDDVPHDNVTIDGTMADMVEVLAVFAVQYANENDVVTIDRARIEQIKAVFWDMNSVSYDVEEIEHTDDEGNTQTETILHIHISHKTEQEMRIIYAFNDQQNEALDGVLEYRSILLGLIGNLGEIQGDAQFWIDNLPADLPIEKRKIVETACSLVGKVSYFWGGKYSAIGWCNSWGELRQVTADGSKSTSTMRIYGLDCSGFVTWVFINASGNVGASGIIGEGTKNQYANSTEISWSEAQIGDLVFYPDLSHIGIVVGFDQDGDVAIAHENATDNNVAITGKRGFTLICRPSFSMF